MTWPLLSYALAPAALTALVGIGIYAIRRYVSSTVDHRFALRIEDHKHDLQRVAEQERFALQRRLTGAQLYLQQQYTAAAEVYSAVRKAHGFAARLFEPQRRFVLDSYNEADLRELMSNHEIFLGKQEEILAIALSSPERAADALADFLVQLRIPKARRELRNATNLATLNELFFSETANDAVAEFIGVCERWIESAPRRNEQESDVDAPLLEELDEAMKRVHSALRADLSNPISPRADHTLSLADAD